MYSAIIQVKLTQDVILNPLKFEQQSFDQGFQIYIRLDISIFDFVRSASPDVECLFRFVYGLFV